VIADLVKLARPRQWHKGAFVLLGPAYAVAAGEPVDWAAVLLAFLAFGFASSACYVVNDIRDRDEDAAHPRKKHRPIASGRVTPGAAVWLACVLMVLSAASVALVGVRTDWSPASPWLGVFVALYVLNVTLYSIGLKRLAVIDVISLATGFVLRVLGGCAAAAVEPSSWLLNVAFFVSMFLALGKRLGERRTMGDGAGAAAVRAVQASYTDEILRRLVVVTGVACLGTYAGYVQAQGQFYTPHFNPAGSVAAARGWGMNLLWPTMLPATYGLLRCIVLLEKGVYDDPTELAARDRPFQVSAGLFCVLTAAAVVWGKAGS
jgi:decaprenyl-phosphate phosphoribosyltransferase